MKQGNLEFLKLGGFCPDYFSLQDGLGRPHPNQHRHYTQGLRALDN